MCTAGLVPVPSCTQLYPAVPCSTQLYPAVPCCALLCPAVTLPRGVPCALAPCHAAPLQAPSQALVQHELAMHLVGQLLSNQALLDVLDEFYFEHHVSRGNPMAYHGWGHHVPRSLAQSYDLFLRLRRAGVRAHSWV